MLIISERNEKKMIYWNVRVLLLEKLKRIEVPRLCPSFTIFMFAICLFTPLYENFMYACCENCHITKVWRIVYGDGDVVTLLCRDFFFLRR